MSMIHDEGANGEEAGQAAQRVVQAGSQVILEKKVK
jgi:hypothetical protein